MSWPWGSGFLKCCRQGREAPLPREQGENGNAEGKVVANQFCYRFCLSCPLLCSAHPTWRCALRPPPFFVVRTASFNFISKKALLRTAVWHTPPLICYFAHLSFVFLTHLSITSLFLTHLFGLSVCFTIFWVIVPYFGQN